MGTVDIAPLISDGKWMYAHVVVGIEVDGRDVIARVADEVIVAVIDDEELVVAW